MKKGRPELELHTNKKKPPAATDGGMFNLKVKQMITANLTLLNPIDQIKKQNMSVDIESGNENFIDVDKTLFEDDEISVDVNLEIVTDENPDWGKSVKSFKVHFLSAYDNRECEDLSFLTLREKREIENHLQNFLNINLI
ncbi:hypothetical protein V2E39_22700 [Chryseobacterium arthrosphaerae]|uniref:Uncharacterized protein n=1 Tax=Chryseobacterium arthrosphaerae TaxID=651561 RepID=A0ABU7R661_9FLAO